MSCLWDGQILDGCLGRGFTKLSGSDSVDELEGEERSELDAGKEEGWW